METKQKIAYQELMEWKRNNPNSKKQWEYCKECGIYEEVKRKENK